MACKDSVKIVEEYRKEVCNVENKILKITGDPLISGWHKNLNSSRKVDRIETLLGDRYYALSKLFQIRCSDADVSRIETINERLLSLMEEMYHRITAIHHQMHAMPAKEGKDFSMDSGLKYVCETETDVTHLDDDDYYSSDFARLILINSYIQREYKGDVDITVCLPVSGKDVNPAMTDSQLGLNDPFDDDTSWSLGWLNHPKLKNINLCYAIYSLATHCRCCIPDMLHLNHFKIYVNFEFKYNNQ